MPTTFADLRTLVNGQTKRPELTAVTDLAIKTATLRAHHTDFYQRDQTSVLLTYTIPTGNQVLVDIPNIFTTAARLRTPNFIQGEDATTLLPNENLGYVSDYKHLWNEYGELQPSRFALLGTGLKIRFAKPTGRCRLYFFQNPNTAEVGYSSWIADDFQEEIAYWAAGIVWARTGNLEQAQVAQRMHVEPFKELLTTSYLSSAKV